MNFAQALNIVRCPYPHPNSSPNGRGALAICQFNSHTRHKSDGNVPLSVVLNNPHTYSRGLLEHDHKKIPAGAGMFDAMHRRMLAVGRITSDRSLWSNSNAH
jgi:hypothetical protein